MLGYLCFSCGNIIDRPLLEKDSEWKRCPECSAVLTEKTWKDFTIYENPRRLTRIIERTILHFPEINHIDFYYAPNCVGGFIHKKSKNAIFIGDINFLNDEEVEWLVAHEIAYALEVKTKDLDDFIRSRGFHEGKSAHSKITQEAYKRGFIFPAP